MLCGISAFNVNAGVVFFEDFESGWGNWSADNGIWEVGTPTEGPDDCYNGSKCSGTVLDGEYPRDTNSRLISPSIILPEISGNQEIHLTFWHSFFYGQVAGRHIQVSIYDNQSGQWSDWETIDESGPGSSPIWSFKSVDLSSYGGEKVKIAFYHINAATILAFGWYIDDVEINSDAPSVPNDPPTPDDPPTSSGDCVATYQLDGSLHIPCVSVPNGFGGTIMYEADMQLIPFSSPFAFELTGAKAK